MVKKDRKNHGIHLDDFKFLTLYTLVYKKEAEVTLPP